MISDFEFSGILGRLVYGDSVEKRQLWTGLPTETRTCFLQRLAHDKSLPLLLFFLGKELESKTAKQCQEQQQLNFFRATRDECALKKLFVEFEKRSIRFAPIKGIDLAYGTYPSPSLRSFGDWDILFHPDDIDRAVEFLHEEGWSDIRHIKRLQGGHHDSPLVKGPFFLEPHYTLPCFQETDPIALWNCLCLRSGSLFQYELPPELKLILVARHASEDHYRFASITSFLTDAAFILRKYQINWQRLRTLCQDLNQPYSGNFFASFHEFFPEVLIAEMKAVPDKVRAYRSIFQQRKLFLATPDADFMLNDESRFSAGWWYRVFHVFHPKNIRYAYHIEDKGILCLIGAYAREFWKKICKLTTFFLHRNRPVDGFIAAIRNAEENA